MDETVWKAKIMIVEDTPSSLKMLMTALRDQGYEIIVATSGKVAIERIKITRPDIILMDIMMPEMDGYETCRQLKSSDETKNIPIIFTSSLRHTFDKVKGFEYGGVDYVAKPIDPPELLSRVQTHLTIRRLQKKLEDANVRLEEKVRARTEALEKTNLRLVEEINNRKSKEKTLLESEQRYRAVVENIPAMICRLLPDGTITFVNKAYCDYLSKTEDELIGQDFFQWIPEKSRHEIRDHLQTLNPTKPMTTYEHQVVAADGTIRWQECTDQMLLSEQGHLSEYQSIVKDVTHIKHAQAEKEKIEKQLQQAQKMEAIGALARGIAHDFNNILTSVLGYTERAIENLKKADDHALHDLEMVQQAGLLAKDMVKQILRFSRLSDTDFRAIDMQLLVDEALKLLLISLPVNIEIKKKIGPIAGKVMGDKAQIYQVVMNLCMNAIHAMGKKHGILTVELSEKEIKTPVMCHKCQMAPGTYVVLAIADTGCGVNDAMMQRIFDPYYSTKSHGEGTGLGLAVAQGIVKSHRAGIHVQSTPGVGTVFTLYFPVIMVLEETEISNPSPVLGGTERILFVDDEAVFLDFSFNILTNLGYDVTIADGSSKALEIFSIRPDRFDLLITDQTMPKMTGLDLARQVHTMRPDLPIILCTGFSEVIDEKSLDQVGILRTLYKPTTKRDLAFAIRTVLDE